MICPTCQKKPSVKAFTPFCSDRCKQVDLGRWMLGSYTVPVVELDEDDILPEAPDEA